MFHLIWSIINVLIILYFLYLVIGFIRKGKRIFEAPFNTVSILIVAFGISQICLNNNSDKNEKIITNHAYIKTNTSQVKRIILEDNLTFNIHMAVEYSKEQNVFIPIENFSLLSGFVSGFDWELNQLQTENYIADQPTAFTAVGTLKWKFFGLNIYNQPKTLSGFI